jgi:glutamyl-Q tRNA(Asp) synthetase
LIVSRFAPSPTGCLHLGHAFSALFAWRHAREGGGRFLLRLEDIDASRCRPEYATAILEDLAWLGLDWDGEVRVQSQHLRDYRATLDRLAARGLLYPCFCTRTDIQQSASAPHTPGASLTFEEAGEGLLPCHPERFGDVVLARKDAPASYHLCVTHDDALQGITLVTRGADLKPATDLHRMLQALMGWPVPRYAHHKLLTDASGRRLAKRDRAATLRDLRSSGRSREDVWALIDGLRAS